MSTVGRAPLSGRYLSFVEREEIAILHARRHTVRGIAKRLGRSPSTISRELRRNAATRRNPSLLLWKIPGVLLMAS
jgi:IS30 family transposase